MIANYHTHTWRCNHASGTEREYVENALKQKLHILGFSDHSPYIFPGEYYSHFRMKLDQLQDYVDTVLSLRKEYAGRIEIPLGLELEYYPKLLPNLLPVLRDYPLDYFILGQHFVGNEIDEHYSGWPTDNPRILQRYVDQVIEGMYSGVFTYVAHPDLIHFTGEASVYSAQMNRLCKAAKNCGVPLEVNLLGFVEKRVYPNVLFWEQAATENCAVILGRDAHKPQHLLDDETERRVMDLIAPFQFSILDTVPLRSIR